MTSLIERAGLIAKLPVALDHQVTGTFGECERMAYYQHVLGRVPMGEAFPLIWGKTFHAATDIWETTSDVDKVVASIDSNLPEETDDRYGRNRGRMYELFLNWVNWRKLNPIKTLRSEQSVSIRCVSGEGCPYFDSGCGLEYGGRMDRIVEWSGMRGPFDFKTTVMDESDPTLEYRPNHQFEGYVWAASHLMGDHCWGLIVERILCNKSKMAFQRYPVSFARAAIREWVTNEHRTQRRLLKQFNDHPYDETEWTQNYARCGKPYPCHYRDVCMASPEGGFRYKLLATTFDEKRWNFQNPDEMVPEEATV